MAQEKNTTGSAQYDHAFFEFITVSSLRSARAVVPLVIDLVRPSSVIDLGCGTGAWLSAFKENGIIRITGVDGDYVDRSKLLIPTQCFKTFDLSNPFSSEEKYDLAVSLEVAEHLSPETADSHVASLVKLAPFVLFSAAIPHQRGTHHVNEQWPEYWEAKFAKHGFRQVDALRFRIWHHRDVESWFKQNIYLYIDEEQLRKSTRWEEYLWPASHERLTLILRDTLSANLQARESLKETLKQLPGRVWHAIKLRLLGRDRKQKKTTGK